MVTVLLLIFLQLQSAIFYFFLFLYLRRIFIALKWVVFFPRLFFGNNFTALIGVRTGVARAF